MKSVEMLIASPISSRGEKMMRAMASCAPQGSVVTQRYTGGHDTLMIYGPGAPVRIEQATQHRKSGGHVIMFDLSYWDREHSMRVSIDHLHPTPEQLASVPSTGRRDFKLRQDADPDGPILLIGLGSKSNVAYGYDPLEWESKTLQRIRNEYPGRSVHWRPKGARAIKLPGTILRHGMPIEKALRGCSLVVCRHSNVAVDACIAGIPVDCDAGAAYSLYRDDTTPTAAARKQFLQRLSWFNWGFKEAPQCWKWLHTMIR